MHLHPIDYVLWLTAPVAQLGVLIIMYKRDFHRDFPFFFNYTILQVLTEPVLFIIQRNSYTFYYWGYWVSVALSALLSFAVLQEIFKDAFRPYEALRDLSVILFRWSALVVLLVAVMWAINSTHSNQNDTITTTILLMERSVRLAQCGLVFFLILLGGYLGISRHNMVFGIAVGFGFFAAVNMLVTTAASQPSIVHVSTLRSINSAAYVVSSLIWLGYTALAPARRGALVAIRSKTWNSALEDAREPIADSLLDNMDRTVERLLYPREEVKVSVHAGERS
jgi:hypothetical protein